ncbi:MAG: hypothetical protein E7665_09310 [Ruminococcaceae bacterium]|nr:hypothetical protein [Oscillospiraceae bacterium]
MKIRDKFWLFASRAHDDDIWLGKSTNDRFTRWSRITPAEGALMLGVPNVIMIGSDGDPAPFSAEAYGYMESFCRMKEVVWSVTGSGGFRTGNEERFICELAKKYPNITGAFADDFLGFGEDQGKGSLISDIRSVLDTSVRPLSMWATFYTRDIEKSDPAIYGMFDNLSLWTWEYKELDNLKTNYELFERKYPKQKKYLGIYILDYPSGEPVPNEYMELQCEYGLELIRSGRAEGMIFLTNCVMGVGLPSEYWLREWIDKVGDETLE